MNKTIALITAAGNGQRMNHTENKLFLKIKGMSIIQRTVQTFLKINSIERLYLTVQSQELNKMQDELKNLDGSNKLRFVIGGQTRQESILNGLEKIALDFKEVTKSVKNEMICLIHDGARPLIEKSTIQQCIEEIKTNHCGIGVAVPINDTIKIKILLILQIEPILLPFKHHKGLCLNNYYSHIAWPKQTTFKQQMIFLYYDMQKFQLKSILDILIILK